MVVAAGGRPRGAADPDRPAPRSDSETLPRPHGRATARGLVNRYGEHARCSTASTPSSTAGRLHAVTGPSGSGKTTLLHLLAGLELPDAGTIAVDGVELTTLDRARARGAAPREDRLRRAAGRARAAPLGARERRARARAARPRRRQPPAAFAALESVGLGERATQRVAPPLAGRAGARRDRARARRRGRRCCSPTSRPPGSTARTRSPSRSCSPGLPRDTGAAVVCATHDPLVIEQADAQITL